ncbi:3-hydroxyacyl-CoA dehydrogenase/enoyl-CoA hydratase/3-hydroxybutyryl-CoA epimerase [Saccharopolyspora erythraea NRRL 2338]|uniref:3-hydroxyacyl-CoA dehydrogenase n=2 Tax=Saccharopolyspora erythraea TaxID=1836 RepID=A4FNA7_SACEN|nr:3-hydroxyacyl-CoA dehydrogenase NAD-binding domain-containing protein [Saccharopolyspora erythraea]EQD87090.1 3-hydroxyacyl-CoA dehydrogenase [Saccharopolyspora erythraea D]PFG99171.1 3-hydroxyacyl-CoA dehydrogenase/enoyl-CoA hydratase/3-hydroxybutyryl-CoA epimerase [Saccharopolyspora erythraea NRRL 2338]QRK89120.1 enoyl-CoA hydratase/isomerase family protein [Saccharopolyspora erythraea]CAM05532.1 putative 3-hydroxyacyl-CoA dehydrogenase [Saccharopolyspora erythraea NRRL 2338]
MSEQSTIRWTEEDGVVVLTLDDPQQQANTMNERYVRSMEETLQRLEDERERITGVVLTSAKSTFFAGGDLRDLIRARPENVQQITETSRAVKQQLRRLETLGVPVVAALNGTALGGGLEIALGCHHRVALNDAKSRFGFPEVTLGLLPGAGGVVRTVRLIGIADALVHVLTQGQRLRPERAKELGLVDELVDTPEELLTAAKDWIKANPQADQPWDRKGYKIPGGTPSTPSFAANLPAFPANLRKQLKGAPYPAPRNILCAAVEGAQVDVDTAFEIEGRYFVELVCGQTAKNMSKAFFFDLQHVNSGGSRPDGVEQWQAKKVAVLGGGMMGAGIAHVCAKAGMQVVIKDVSVEAAEKGKAYSKTVLDKAIAKGRSTEAKRDEVLARITATDKAADLAGADLVIEAVFEDTKLKHQVYAEIEDVIDPDALICSNTSTLPITTLAEGVRRREDFIGLHFFSPVDKMPLVEIIRGERTSDRALARAFDVVRQISKTPIVVNDSRGFFTSRVIGTFLNEGVAMLAEGVHPASIEQASAQAGFPAPVLQLFDELTLTLPRRIREETRRAVEAQGGTWAPHPADAVLDRMVEEFDRKGRSGGAGFYEYADGKRTRLWPGLLEHFGTGADPSDVDLVDLRERMLFIEALETVRCLDEGVLLSVPDANIGSIMGIGFPAWTGGVVQYMNGYPGGLAGFVARSRELAARYGERFEPPASLVRRAEAGEPFELGEPDAAIVAAAAAA